MATDRYLTPEDVRALAIQFQASRILLTAFELDVFTLIGDRTKSSTQVAKIIKANARATDRLMNALVALGLLEKKNGAFSNTSAARRFLVRDSREYIAGLAHSAHLWESWSTLTEAVRKGSTVVMRKEINKRSAEWLEAFIGAMHDRAKKQAPAIVQGIDLTGVRRVLDVGGGPGTFSMAFVQSAQGINATVFDLPNVIPLTKRYIAEAGLSGKVDTIIGDYLKDKLPKGYDLVFLSAIIHSNSPSENKKLIGKCARALNTGGRVAVMDWIMDERRTTPIGGAFFALNMLVGTDAGDTYTESEIVGWMKTAGLSRITRQETRFGTGLIIGRNV